MTETNDRPLTLAQASEYLDGRVSGDLRGRNLGGNVGWITTESAVIEWIKRGNGPGRVDVRTKGHGGDHESKQGEQGQG